MVLYPKFLIPGGIIYIMKQKRSTIKQVAEKAGVSPATISRYLNNSRSFPDDVTRRIKEAIESLHYAPNANARSLKQNKTRIIGMIIPDMVVYIYICKIIEHILYDHHYSLMIATSDYDSQKEGQLLQKFFQQGVDGILLASCGQNNEHISFIKDQGIPIVLFDRFLQNLPDMNYVLEKGVECIQKITEYAISQGHRKIAYMQGPSNELVSTERFDEFRRILQKHGIHENPRFYYKHVMTQEQIREASNDIIDHISEVSIVITTNAKQIKYFVMTANERGIKIPDDISITGFGLDEYRTLFPYPITCIIQNHVEIGRQCAKMMLELINDEEPQERIVMIDSDFFIGDSIRRLC